MPRAGVRERSTARGETGRNGEPMDVSAAQPGLLRIGVMGDLHSHWDDFDRLHFDRSEYDLLLCTGDLGGGTPGSGLNIAKSMAHLRKPTLVMPGNNDVADFAQLSAEFTHQRGLNRILTGSRTRGGGSVGEVRMCGYSLHRLSAGDLDVTMIAARPHSLGGPELSFADHVEQTYGIATIDESLSHMLRLIDDVQSRRVMFLSHNGPTGFGGEPADMWGCDFKAGGGDWGDPDLEHAIDHARGKGHEVLAVIAGHMHLRTKQGVERPWMCEKDGTLYVNAARVPRIFANGGETYRHHVAVKIDEHGISAEEILVG